MPDQQGQTVIGLTDPSLRQMVRAIVSLEDALVRLTEIHQGERQTWQETDQANAQALAAAQARIAELEAQGHREMVTD